MIPLNQASNISGKKALIRCDLDVPIKNGEIQSTFRLDHMLPSLQFLIESESFPILIGHMGRPKGKFDGKLSTTQLKPYFDEKIGQDAYELLENLRFDPREEENDLSFAKELASKADFYVNESFSTCHRSHTSITAIPHVITSYAGLRLTEEVSTLENIFHNPKRPLVAIVGGAKLESKKPAVQKFLDIADYVLVGGKIGLDWDEGTPKNLKIAPEYTEDTLDIGPKSIKLFSKIISKAQTVVWAGPLGAFETKGRDVGTRGVAEAIVNSSAYSIIGGGDTISAASRFGLLEKFGFVSTGGGAMLEFVVKNNLPGLEALGYNG